MGLQIPTFNSIAVWGGRVAGSSPTVIGAQTLAALNVLQIKFGVRIVVLLLGLSIHAELVGQKGFRVVTDFANATNASVHAVIQCKPNSAAIVTSSICIALKIATDTNFLTISLNKIDAERFGNSFGAIIISVASTPLEATS